MRALSKMQANPLHIQSRDVDRMNQQKMKPPAARFVKVKPEQNEPIVILVDSVRTPVLIEGTHDVENIPLARE